MVYILQKAVKSGTTLKIHITILMNSNGSHVLLGKYIKINSELYLGLNFNLWDEIPHFVGPANIHNHEGSSILWTVMLYLIWIQSVLLQQKAF